MNNHEIGLISCHLTHLSRQIRTVVLCTCGHDVAASHEYHFFFLLFSKVFELKEVNGMKSVNLERELLKTNSLTAIHIPYSFSKYVAAPFLLAVATLSKNTAQFFAT